MPYRFRVFVNAKAVAAFSDYLDACHYARCKSNEPALVDVVNRTGIVMQYQAGQPTPEFAGRDDRKLWAAA